MKRLKSFETLKTHKEFSKVYKEGKKVHTDTVVYYFLPHETFKKVAFVASKKVGGAVDRNLSKRYARASFVALSDELVCGTHLFVLKELSIKEGYHKVHQDITYAMTKLSSLHN